MSKRKAETDDDSVVVVYAVAIQYNQDDYKDRSGGGWSSLGDIRLFRTKDAAEAYVLEKKRDFIRECEDNGKSLDDDLTIEEQFDKLNEGEFVPTLMDIYLEKKRIE